MGHEIRVCQKVLLFKFCLSKILLSAKKANHYRHDSASRTGSNQVVWIRKAFSYDLGSSGIYGTH